MSDTPPCSKCGQLIDAEQGYDVGGWVSLDGSDDRRIFSHIRCPDRRPANPCRHQFKDGAHCRRPGGHAGQHRRPLEDAGIGDTVRLAKSLGGLRSGSSHEVVSIGPRGHAQILNRDGQPYPLVPCEYEIVRRCEPMPVGHSLCVTPSPVDYTLLIVCGTCGDAMYLDMDDLPLLPESAFVTGMNADMLVWLTDEHRKAVT